jgi:hypothetical protein
MHDYQYNSQPVTAVVHTAPPPRRVRWGVLGPLLVGAMGVLLAAATLALLLVWKGSVTVQISQLRAQLVTAQATEAGNGAGLSGMTRRLDGMNRSVTALESLVGGYTYVCSQDLTGPNGPAVFVFPCQQKG